MLTRSETSFRVWFKKKFPGGFIKKIPDFKATGNISAAGLPDYLTVVDGVTVWVEVKTWKAKSFTSAQRRVFPEMIKAGAVILVWIKEKRGFSSYIYEDVV